MSSGPWTSARARSLRISLADAARKTDLARPRCCADDPGRTGRAGPSPPIRRKIRRFAASICLPRAARQQPSGSATRRRAGRFVPLRKERNRSFRFRPSVPSLRNGRCYSGLKDPARPSAARTVSTPFGSRNVRLAGRHGRPAKRAVVQIQKFLFRVETKDFLVTVSSALRIIAADQVFVDHSPAPLRGAGASISVRAHRDVAHKRLRHIHAAGRLRALRLSSPLAYRFSTGGAGDAYGRYLYWPGHGGPPPTPTPHVLGSRPSPSPPRALSILLT